jgi:hypothetical protein
MSCIDKNEKIKGHGVFTDAAGDLSFRLCGVTGVYPNTEIFPGIKECTFDSADTTTPVDEPANIVCDMKRGWFKNTSNVCVHDSVECTPTEWFDKTDDSCKACDANCLNCRGAATQCLTCPTNLFLEKKSDLTFNCVTDCADGSVKAVLKGKESTADVMVC